MADQQDTRTREELLAALQAAQNRAYLAELELAALRRAIAVLRMVVMELDRRSSLRLPRCCSAEARFTLSLP